MGQHGLINWADDDKACYELTLSLIEKAAKYIEEHDKGEKTFGGQKYQSLNEEERNKLLIQLLPKSARNGLAEESLYRHSAYYRECTSICEQRRSSTPCRNRNILP